MCKECELYKSFYESDQKKINQLYKELEEAKVLSNYFKKQNENLIKITLNVSEKITIINNNY